MMVDFFTAAVPFRAGVTVKFLHVTPSQLPEGIHGSVLLSQLASAAELFRLSFQSISRGSARSRWRVHVGEAGEGSGADLALQDMSCRLMGGHQGAGESSGRSV